MSVPNSHKKDSSINLQCHVRYRKDNGASASVILSSLPSCGSCASVPTIFSSEFPASCIFSISVAAISEVDVRRETEVRPPTAELRRTCLARKPLLKDPMLWRFEERGDDDEEEW